MRGHPGSIAVLREVIEGAGILRQEFGLKITDIQINIKRFVLPVDCGNGVCPSSQVGEVFAVFFRVGLGICGIFQLGSAGTYYCYAPDPDRLVAYAQRQVFLNGVNGLFAFGPPHQQSAKIDGWAGCVNREIHRIILGNIIAQIFGPYGQLILPVGLNFSIDSAVPGPGKIFFFISAFDFGEFNSIEAGVRKSMDQLCVNKKFNRNCAGLSVRNGECQAGSIIYAIPIGGKRIRRGGHIADNRRRHILAMPIQFISGLKTKT